MTAAALRAEAAAKDELAVRITAEARGLADLLAPVLARMGGDVWRGPAADDFAAASRRWRSRLDSESDALLGVARRLRLRADELRAEAARVEAAQEAAAAARLEAAARRAEMARAPA